MNEFDLIRRVRARTARSTAGVVIGPGDDCAVLETPLRRQLITTDVLTEGVDFLLAESGPFAVGRKAMAVNLSDIAAMAGLPRFAVVGLVLPRSVASANGTEALAERLFDGLQQVADEFGVAIVGGDTNSWDQGLVVSVTLIGEVSERGPVLRSGAIPGDWIFVTGPLGGSLLGRHLRPTPRLHEAMRIHQMADIHAMIDISDGLTADLNHILEESRCGAVLNSIAIPVHADAIIRAEMTGQTPLEHALDDGEDFELIFVVAPEDGQRLLREPPCQGLRKIGMCVDAGLWIETENIRRPLLARGWQHNWVESSSV